MGGADLTSESLKIVKAFQGLSNQESYRLSILLNSKHKTYQEIIELAKYYPNIDINDHADDMVQFIASQDIIFGALGTSVWERAALGVPSVCVIVAENQREAALTLEKNLIVNLLGDGEKTTKDNWIEVFEEIRNLKP